MSEQWAGIMITAFLGSSFVLKFCKRKQNVWLLHNLHAFLITEKQQAYHSRAKWVNIACKSWCLVLCWNLCSYSQAMQIFTTVCLDQFNNLTGKQLITCVLLSFSFFSPHSDTMFFQTSVCSVSCILFLPVWKS